MFVKAYTVFVIKKIFMVNWYFYGMKMRFKEQNPYSTYGNRGSM
jgi:hypothetical protein